MEAFHRAGIDTVMLTGDQRSTARAIGQQLNLSRNGELTILDAQALAQLEGDGVQAQVRKVDIFARISPADKLQIVRALQRADKIVAMTGDGINDTPALKAANVGLAMGSGQSEGVHDVADVVIQDDNLSTLIDAVSQGRTIYTNIRKAVHFFAGHQPERNYGGGDRHPNRSWRTPQRHPAALAEPGDGYFPRPGPGPGTAGR